MPRRKKQWRDQDPFEQRAQAAKARPYGQQGKEDAAPDPVAPKTASGVDPLTVQVVADASALRQAFQGLIDSFQVVSIQMAVPPGVAVRPGVAGWVRSLPQPEVELPPDPEPTATYPGVAIGHREWNLTSDGRLTSIYGGSQIWPYREALTAYHDVGKGGVRATHEAPCFHCPDHGTPGCGIYARTEPDPHEEGLVWGTVKLWGKMIRHSHGWRARYAYPKALHVRAARMNTEYAAQLAQRLSVGYGVPCDVRDYDPAPVPDVTRLVTSIPPSRYTLPNGFTFFAWP